mgnify:CR=1 FL=1|jgi:hypothetical protein
MKKLALLLLFIPFFIFGQNPVKVQVTEQKSFSQSFNDGLKAGAAVRAAAAANRSAAAAQASAQSEALKNNSEKIEIDLLKGYSNKYKYLVIKRVSGWATSGNFVTITNEINSAKRYQIVSLNSLGMYITNFNSANATSKDRKSRKIIQQIDKNQFYEPDFPQQYLNDSETLFLEWSREAVTPIDRLSRLTLKNSSGETLYQAEYKNKGYSEMLRPLLSNYNFGKEDAKSKLIELKEYLDLGIITQDEFDEKAKPLKKILIGS